MAKSTIQMAQETPLEGLASLINTDPDQALKLMQARELLRKEQEIAKQVAENARAEEARLIAVQEAIERKQAEQDGCLHMKENYKPAIGGQRDSRGNALYICLRCQKEWQNNDLPPHLRIPHEFIGGPQF